MNFHKLITAVIISAFISVFGANINAQKSSYLPENLTLSFNGTFQPISTSEYRVSSENGLYKAKYDIGAVSDEMRELKNLQMFEGAQLIFALKDVPGSDVYISNTGNLAVLDMKFHYQQEVTVNLFNKHGKLLLTQSFRYASLFGFSPIGEKFIVGTDKNLNVIDLSSKKTTTLESCSQFAFSNDEQLLATAKEGEVKVYEDYLSITHFNTGFTYPRGIAVSNNKDVISVVDKNHLKVYSVGQNELTFENNLPEYFSYRDIRAGNDDRILAGVHYRNNGISKGILHVYNLDGNEYAFEFKETIDGGFIIAGYTETKNIFLIKTDSVGTVQWAKRFLSDQSCFAYSLNLCSDGGFIIGGRIGDYNYDALIIRTDERGNIILGK